MTTAIYCGILFIGCVLSFAAGYIACKLDDLKHGVEKGIEKEISEALSGEEVEKERKALREQINFYKYDGTPQTDIDDMVR